jgi:alkaline phosphatase
MQFFKKSTKLLIIFVLTIVLSLSVSACADKNSESESFKNVILMIGDGMGLNHIMATEIYYERNLYMRQNPNSSGFVTTCSYDSEITDSAAAGTAMACGKKTKNGYVGKDSDGNDMENIMDLAMKKEKKTGIIVTCTLDDATPAAFSSHAIYRKDYDVIRGVQIESGINLFMGLDHSYDRDAIAAAGYTLITQKQQLNADAEKIFALLPSIEPEELCTEESSELKDLVSFGLDYLDNEKGFMLMIEGSNIDKKSHNNDLMGVLYETNAFDLAVKTVVDWATQRDDTLVIVTADHECGGLTFLEGLSKQTIEDTVIFTSVDHTAENVPYFIFGLKKKPKSLMDNIEIFELCKNYL